MVLLVAFYKLSASRVLTMKRFPFLAINISRSSSTNGLVDFHFAPVQFFVLFKTGVTGKIYGFAVAKWKETRHLIFNKNLTEIEKIVQVLVVAFRKIIFRIQVQNAVVKMCVLIDFRSLRATWSFSRIARTEIQLMFFASFFFF